MLLDSRRVPPAGSGSLSCRSSSSASSSGGGGRSTISADPLVDGMWLQSQVDTLQWQLRQAESSRHMYRAVLGQVVRFLERAHTSLDAMQKRAAGAHNKTLADSGCRVPRSRSVHTVNASSIRPASCDREALGVQRARSVTQIGASGGALAAQPASRDFTWRRPRASKLEPEELPPEKLSQEAFRLLRTVHSLLNTREPDLAHRLAAAASPCVSPIPSPSPVTAPSPSPSPAAPAHVDDTALAFRRQLQIRSSNATLTPNPAIPTIPTIPTTPSRPYATLPRRPLPPPPPPPPHTPQPSVSSAEDESGFSSLGSFQEVGLPIMSSTIHCSGSFHEVGLPPTDPPPPPPPPCLPPLPPHRRWSSTPTSSPLPLPPPLCSPVKSGESLRVLWV